MANDRGSGTLTGAGVGVIVWFGSGVPVEYYSLTVPGSFDEVAFALHIAAARGQGQVVV